MSSVKSVRAEHSRAEKARRIRSVGRALKQDVSVQDIMSRGFTWAEITDARELFGLPVRNYGKRK